MLKNKRFLIIPLVCFVIESFGQSGTSSPYSLTAIGELQYDGFVQHVATGGNSVSVRNINSFSRANPASLTALQFTVFDAGARTSLGQLKTETQQANTRSGNFKYFAMAFPFQTKRKMAVSFGTNQMSDVGYEIKNTINTDTPSYYNLFQGSGGMSRVYLGYGIELIKNLSIGVNLDYNFGNISAERLKVYPRSNNTYSFFDGTLLSYRGGNFDVGVQYTIQDTVLKSKGEKSIINHTFGATYNSGVDLIGSGFRYAETFEGEAFDQRGAINTIDTVLFNDNNRDTITKPIGFTVGYTINNGQKWQLSLETEQNMWSTVTDGITGNKFFNNSRYSAGFSVTPKPVYGEKGEYLKKVRYSAGVRYENLYYNFQGTQLNELGISFGLGLPVVKSIRIEDEKVAIVSMVNITAEYVTRGTTTNGLVQEDYLNIAIGFNLNDKWFTKRKYR